jgi:hypothetical protein
VHYLRRLYFLDVSIPMMIVTSLVVGMTEREPWWRFNRAIRMISEPGEYTVFARNELYAVQGVEDNSTVIVREKQRLA